MSFSSVDIENALTAPTFLGREGNNTEAGRLVRDRSYSDAHCLIEKARSTDAAFKIFPVEADHDSALKEGTVRAKHLHGVNRPRSKSESEYRPSHHTRKKHGIHHKQLSGTHSPHHGPRPLSPNHLSSPTSCGKMWIRPVPIRNQAACISPSQTQHENQYCTSPLKSISMPTRIRHVSQESGSPADEAEMDINIPVLYSSPNSSFDGYHGQRRPVVAFGESGKPIKPIAMFSHQSPTDTVGLSPFQWKV